MRLILILFPFILAAQPWLGILDPARATDWTTAGAGAIPTTRTNCTATACNTLFGGTVTTASITAAITAASAGQVVRIPAGTFTITGTPAGSQQGIIVAKDNITIRGAGPDQTIIKFSSDGTHSGGNDCNGLGAAVCVKASDAGWNQDGPEHTANWTAGYSQGTTVVTLSTVANLSAGMLLALDQLDDTSDDGSIFNCQSTSARCTQQGTDVGRGSGASKRSQVQLVRVVSIQGTNVTIDPALRMPNWRTDRTPGAWWGTGQPITGVGIEDITLDYSSLGTSRTYAAQFQMAYKCWMKNVRSINGNNAHVNMYLSMRLTVRDSYFYGTQNAASQSYGFEPWMGGDHLWENNIFKHIASPYVLSGGQGIVASYTYSLDDYYNNGDSAWFQGAQYHHESGSNYALWEGNSSPGWTADNIHGPGFFATGFRNRIDGKDPLNTNNKTEQTVPVDIYALSRYFNVIGNVLGYSGYHTAYEVYTTTTGAQSGGANCDVTIYRLGWNGNCSNGDGVGDPTLRTTMMRWGNWDTFTSTVDNGTNDQTGTRWVSAEVPSGIAAYSNAVPSTHILPSSFYLASVPTSWWGTPWGTPPFPPIGPDVANGNITNTGGHANKIPAQLCYENLSADPAYAANTVKIFNANTCYIGSGGPPPVPPTSLQGTVASQGKVQFQ